MSMLKNTNNIQIWLPSGGEVMERMPSGGLFSPRAKPEGSYPPEGIHSIMLPPFRCNICFIIPNNLPSQLGRCFTFFSKLRHLRMLCSLLLFPTIRWLRFSIQCCCAREAMVTPPPSTMGASHTHMLPTTVNHIVICIVILLLGTMIKNIAFASVSI